MKKESLPVSIFKNIITDWKLRILFLKINLRKKSNTIRKTSRFI